MNLFSSKKFWQIFHEKSFIWLHFFQTHPVVHKTYLILVCGAVPLLTFKDLDGVEDCDFGFRGSCRFCYVLLFFVGLFLPGSHTFFPRISGIDLEWNWEHAFYFLIQQI